MREILLPPRASALSVPPFYAASRARAALAARADVGAAARGAHLLDRRAAADARLALPQVHEEAVLEAAPGAVDVPVVVDRRALRVDPGVQRLHHGVAQRLDLRPPERADRRQRVDAGAPERLVRVDVADPGHALLVQEEGLHGLAPAARLVAQGLGGEVGAQRLHAEPRGEVLGERVAPEQHVARAEAALVHEQHGAPVVERHPHARVLRLVARDQDVPGHPQVHHEVDVVLHRHHEVLAAPPQPLDPAAVQRVGDRLRRRGLRPPRVQHADPLEPPALDGGRELAADGLDLRKLRHSRRF